MDCRRELWKQKHYFLYKNTDSISRKAIQNSKTQHYFLSKLQHNHSCSHHNQLDITIKSVTISECVQIYMCHDEKRNTNVLTLYLLWVFMILFFKVWFSCRCEFKNIHVCKSCNVIFIKFVKFMNSPSTIILVHITPSWTSQSVNGQSMF